MAQPAICLEFCFDKRLKSSRRILITKVREHKNDVLREIVDRATLSIDAMLAHISSIARRRGLTKDTLARTLDTLVKHDERLSIRIVRKTMQSACDTRREHVHLETWDVKTRSDVVVRNGKRCH